MTEYCENCGEELDPDEENEGICKNCKKSLEDEEYKSDEDYIDPGIT
jgi:predicted amidophosphoribosyltransferase